MHLHDIEQCTERILSMRLCGVSAQAERVGQEPVGGWDHLQHDMHVVAGCGNGLVGTALAHGGCCCRLWKWLG